MKRPAFQFYPADWRNNAKLRRCSEASRGAWIDVICLMHDSDEYGVLRWPLKDIARAAGIPKRLLTELAEKGVLKGDDKAPEEYVYSPRHAGKTGDPVVLVDTKDGEPCWYCSRLVRDEFIRQRRGGDTRFSGTKQPQKPKPKPPKSGEPNPPPKVGIGEPVGDGPSSTSTSTIKPLPAAAGFNGTQAPPTEHPSPVIEHPARANSIDAWQPDPETLSAIRVQGVPEKFIREQLPEFVTYWRDRNEPRTSWNSKFYSRCLSEWKRHGHQWRENPDAAADKESQRRALHEATSGSTRNDW